MLECRIWGKWGDSVTLPWGWRIFENIWWMQKRLHELDEKAAREREWGSRLSSCYLRTNPVWKMYQDTLHLIMYEEVVLWIIVLFKGSSHNSWLQPMNLRFFSRAQPGTSSCWISQVFSLLLYVHGWDKNRTCRGWPFSSNRSLREKSWRIVS